MKRLLACLLIAAPLLLTGCLFDTIVSDFVNSTPRAVIDAAPADGAAPLTVTFDAHYSHVGDGAIAEYHWDFGDPEDRTLQRDSTCTHTYGRAGTYLATLTVVDDEGATDSQRIAIVVANPPPVVELFVSNDSPPSRYPRSGTPRAPNHAVRPNAISVGCQSGSAAVISAVAGKRPTMRCSSPSGVRNWLQR